MVEEPLSIRHTCAVPQTHMAETTSTTGTDESMSITTRSDENAVGGDDDDERLVLWKIPDGAADIVENIAAVFLMQNLLHNPSTPFLSSFCSRKQEPQALASKVDFDAVVQVVRRCPAVCQETYVFRGKDGQKRDLLPLALVCTLQPPLEAVKAIYEAYPAAIYRKEPSRGSIPLHYAAAYDAPVKVLKFLVSENPDGLKARLTENISPLDLACYHFTKTTSYVNIQFLLQVHPEAAADCCSELNWYPLHSAVVAGAPLETVIKPVYNAYPQAASLLGRGTDSPLHGACKKKNYEDVIQFLIQHSDPNILSTEDQEGFTPTLLAAMHQPPRVLESLINLAPIRMDHRGWTLLHFAAVHNEPPAILYLATRFPEMLVSRTQHCRCMPLHLCCRKGGSLDNIRTLTRLNSQVLHMTEATGKTPLELAARRIAMGKSGPSAEAVEFLRNYETNSMVQF